MKKIISFSLYQDTRFVDVPAEDNYYNYGVLCNIELAKIIYPDWVCRIYCGNSVPIEIKEKILSYDNAELILMQENEELNYRMWRFLPIDENDVSVMLCRDADSRLSYREKILVDIFLDSDFLVHSVRDNLNHNDLMAGMWGMKKNNRVNMKELCLEYKKREGQELQVVTADQDFLREKINKIYEDSILTHCSYYLNNFPEEIAMTPDKNGYFIGMPFTCMYCYQELPLNHIFY
jgi:hypothetical protein